MCKTVRIGSVRRNTGGNESGFNTLVHSRKIKRRLTAERITDSSVSVVYNVIKRVKDVKCSDMSKDSAACYRPFGVYFPLCLFCLGIPAVIALYNFGHSVVGNFGLQAAFCD